MEAIAALMLTLGGWAIIILSPAPLVARLVNGNIPTMENLKETGALAAAGAFAVFIASPIVAAIGRAG